MLPLVSRARLEQRGREGAVEARPAVVVVVLMVMVLGNPEVLVLVGA